MSELIDDGGSAFPFGKKNFTDDWSHGMTLRDWFAGQAMISASLIRIAEMSNDVRAKHIDPEDFGVCIEGVAHGAYELADAMLAARKEKQ